MDDIKVQPIKSGEKPPRSNRGILVAAAAAVIAVAGIGIGLALVADGGDVATSPTTLSVEAQQAALEQEALEQAALEQEALEQEALEQAALAEAEAYMAAFNAGDRDAVMGSFTSDVSISDGGDDWIVTEWQLLLAWNIAQGTILTAADCTVAEASSPAAATVTCETGTHVPQAQAIGAPPTPTTLTFLVVPEGIRALEMIYGQPGFGHTAEPFFGWLEARDPEDIARAVFSLSDSVAEAEQKGLLLAQYAEEWAAFLDASDCAYPDSCYRLTEG